MKEFNLLKNRKGLMEDDNFAQAVIEQVRLELADDPDQAGEFSDWWSLSVEIQGRVADINAYSGIYADEKGRFVLEGDKFSLSRADTQKLLQWLQEWTNANRD